MPTRTYSLKRGEPKRLEITSSASLKNTTVRLDGKTIGSIPTKQELEAGKGFPLGDGSVVNVHLLGNAWSGRRIGVERDGRPLPGSPSDPYRQLRGASNAVFIIAGVNLLVGVLVTILASTAVSQSQAADTFSQSQSAGSLGLGVGLGSLIAGPLFLVLGFFIRRKSKIALGIAVGVFALNLVAVIVSVLGGNLTGIVGVPIGIALLSAMSRGFGAIDAIRVEEDTIQQPAQNYGR